MSEFEVKGADQFLRLSKALKEAGDTETRKALHKALRDVVNEVKPKAAEALAEALPARLAARGNAVKQAVVVKTGNDPGVSVVVRYGKAGSGLGAANAQRINRAGSFRHPVFARSRQAVWVDQKVDGIGWFDKTYQNAAPDVRRALEQALEQVADDIVKRAR